MLRTITFWSTLIISLIIVFGLSSYTYEFIKKEQNIRIEAVSPAIGNDNVHGLVDNIKPKKESIIKEHIVEITLVATVVTNFFGIFFSWRGDRRQAKELKLKLLEYEGTKYNRTYLFSHDIVADGDSNAEVNEAEILDNADILFKKGRVIEALNLFKVCLQINPNNYECYWAIANCYTKLGNSREAEHYFQESIKFSPSEFKDNLYYNLANTLYDQKRFSESIEHYDAVSNKSRIFKQALKNKKLAQFMLEKLRK